jgi:hypothetical protein
MGSGRDWSNLGECRGGGEEAGHDNNLDAHVKPLTVWMDDAKQQNLLAALLRTIFVSIA